MLAPRWRAIEHLTPARLMSGVNVQNNTMRQAWLDVQVCSPLSKFVAMFNEVIYFWPSADKAFSSRETEAFVNRILYLSKFND